jgi:hypothetical protein
MTLRYNKDVIENDNILSEVIKMLNQTFGVEIEMSGISREHAAKIIAGYFGTTHQYEGGGYDTWVAFDAQGRKWKCMFDSSIIASAHKYKCELVTPILTYADMNDLQEIVRLMRKARAKSDADHKCGIHVHIGALNHTVQQLKNLVNFMSSYQDIIYKAVKVDPYREGYCRKLGTTTIDRFNTRLTCEYDCEKAWYNTENTNYHKNHHYDSTRYHGLNLHSVFSKGTVEFRVFNGTLHAGLVRAYVVMCLAITNYTKEKSRITRSKKQQFNDKYTMYELLCKMGVKGDEFKSCRDHLTAHLQGGLGHEERYI